MSSSPRPGPRARNLLWLIPFVLVGLPVFAATPALEVRVVDDTALPLAGVAVQAWTPELDGPLKATTDPRGVVRFEDLGPGAYELILSQPGLSGVWLRDIPVSDGVTARTIGMYRREPAGLRSVVRQPAPQGLLRLHLVDGTDADVAGAAVVLSGPKLAEDLSGTTDGQGIVAFPIAEAGSYKLKVDQPGALRLPALALTAGPAEEVVVEAAITAGSVKIERAPGPELPKAKGRPAKPAPPAAAPR